MADALHAEVVAVLDERSAERAADQLQRHFGDAGRGSADVFARVFGSSLGGQARQLGQTAGTELRTGISGGVDDAVRDFTRQFGVMGGTANSTFQAMKSGGGAAALGVAGIGIAAVAVGKQLYDLGAQWDNVADGITGKTGLIGAQLTGLTDIVRNVASTTAIPIENIGNIAGEVSQALKLTGDDAQRMIQTLAQIQQVTGQEVVPRGLAQAFRVFDITDANAQTAAVEGLLHMSQETGISINELAGAMQKSGKATREAGLDWGQTAALLSSFEAAGVDINRVLPSISIALKNLAKDGRDPAEGLAQTIAEIERLGNSPAATKLASETFGKGYLDFLAAIKSTDVGDILAGANTALDKTQQSLEDQKKATQDWTEELQILKNELSTGLAPVADTVFSSINQWLTSFKDDMQFLRGIGGLFGDDARPPMTVPNVPTAPLTADTPWGQNPLLDQARRQAGMTPPAGTTAGPRGIFDISKDVAGASGTNFTGDPQLWRQPDKGGASGPSGPVVPYTGDPMSLLGGMTPTSSLYGAAEGVLTAQHASAQAEAELNALKSDNTATEQERQAAENKLVRANSDQLQAELRLNEAKASATKKFTGQLEEFSAGLDQDFGISKGLSGIVDNLVRLFGTLAAAPALAQLSAISAARGDEGSGMMGMLASTGALGDRFLPTSGVSSATSVSPSAFGSAVAQSFAASPGQSARSFAHEQMMPYWQGQGLTVGDHAADQYGEHQNGALDIMVPDIATGQQVLQQVLSDPNVYGAIFNNQAFGYGQGAAPRPYSGGFTGDPTQDHQDHVHALYKPGGENNIAAGGASGAGWQTGMSPLAGVPAMAGGPVQPGMGLPQGLPGAGGGPGAGGAARSSLGGQSYPASPGGGGISLGGMAMDGLMGATSALDMVMPGAGAGAKMGIQLINRTIKYAGQMAGIGVSGLMSAITPAGDNPKASIGNSWFGKVAGGLAGAKPATPNQSGGKQQQPPGPMSGPGGQQGAQGQQPGQPNTVNFNQTNNNTTADAATGSGIRELSAANFSNPGHQ